MTNERLITSMRSSGVGELLISHTERRNAMTAAMWETLPDKLDNILQENDLKALIIRGDGDHFCAGADISEFGTLYATEDSALHTSEAISTAFRALAEFPLPTLAMIRGTCVGGGCGLALCCDYRIADTTAYFAITPARLGLVYPYEDISRLIETVGIPHAKDILFSARKVSSDEAHAIGLVNQVCVSEELGDRVRDYTEKLCALSSQSLQSMKQMFAAYQSGQRGQNSEVAKLFATTFNGSDFREGYMAFLEKRKPDFGSDSS